LGVQGGYLPHLFVLAPPREVQHHPKKSAWPCIFCFSNSDRWIGTSTVGVSELLLLTRVDFLKRLNWFVSSRENTQNALVKYHVEVVIQPYFQMYYTLTRKFTVLCYNHCPVTHTW
jgi:hypothetical protein